MLRAPACSSCFSEYLSRFDSEIISREENVFQANALSSECPYITRTKSKGIICFGKDCTCVLSRRA
jgi:hypothetical protein